MTAIRTNIQLPSTDTPISPGGSGSLLNRLIDRWVAAIIARREREAARVALRERHRHSPKSPANGCSGTDGLVS